MGAVYNVVLPDEGEGPWVIGSLSMVGYGSLKLGLKYPERFASIYTHSSKIDWSNVELDMSLLAPPSDIDLLAYVQEVIRLDRKPVLSFDCGADDELLDENR